MAIRKVRSACFEMKSELYWGLDNSPIQRDKCGLKTKETQLLSSNPPAALRWGDGRVLEQTNSFFLSWKQQVVAETKKSYEKLATLRKEFGHSGSYKSEDGTLYIGMYRAFFVSVFWEPEFVVFLGDFDSAGVRTGLGHLEVTFWMLIAEALY